MQYRTKHARLIAIWDAYRDAFGKKACTAREVATWAAGEKLWPCPTGGDSDAACERWEGRLAAAVRKAKIAAGSDRTPHNAKCPCGSRHKFKKCCGRTTPQQAHEGLTRLKGTFGIA